MSKDSNGFIEIPQPAGRDYTSAEIKLIKQAMNQWNGDGMVSAAFKGPGMEKKGKAALKGLGGAGISRVVDNINPVAIGLNLYSLKKTNTHIERLLNINGSCSCQSSRDGSLPCYSAIAYAINQKRVKAMRKGGSAVPIVPTGLVVSGTVIASAVNKLALGTKGVLREAHARNLWYAAVKNRCERSQNAIKQLCGSRKSKAALSVHNEGWRYVFDKMAST